MPRSSWFIFVTVQFKLVVLHIRGKELLEQGFPTFVWQSTPVEFLQMSKYP